MATSTTNLLLRKPARADFVSVVDDINGNMDIIDRSVGGAFGAIAIVSYGNSHIAINAGEYVFVSGHNTLDDGLYTANTNIAADGTLSSSNLTAVQKGLGGQVNELESTVGKMSSSKRGATNTSDGKFVFEMPLGSSAILIIGINPVYIIMSTGGTITNSSLPSNYTLTNSGSTVTLTKTASVSTATAVAVIVIAS